MYIKTLQREIKGYQNKSEKFDTIPIKIPIILNFLKSFRSLFCLSTKESTNKNNKEYLIVHSVSFIRYSDIFLCIFLNWFLWGL